MKVEHINWRNVSGEFRYEGTLSGVPKNVMHFNIVYDDNNAVLQLFNANGDKRITEIEELKWNGSGIEIAGFASLQKRAMKYCQDPTGIVYNFNYIEKAKMKATSPNKKEAVTSLMTKEHEPLIIRKYTQKGFPLYVAMICGANLDDLDSVVLDFVEEREELLTSGSIQDKRNICGQLTEHICETYGRKAEGVGVIWYMDKMMISSLFGDMMNHTSCRIELYSLLNMMCHI